MLFCTCWVPTFSIIPAFPLVTTASRPKFVLLPSGLGLCSPDVPSSYMADVRLYYAPQPHKGYQLCFDARIDYWIRIL